MRGGGMNFSDWLFKEEGGKRIIKIHFASVKYDTVDKYYVDLSKTEVKSLGLTWELPL